MQYYCADQQIVVVHYVGDEKTCVRGPHLNSASDRPYYASTEVVRFEIKDYGLTKPPRQILTENRSKRLAGLSS